MGEVWPDQDRGVDGVVRQSVSSIDVTRPRTWLPLGVEDPRLQADRLDLEEFPM